MRGAELVQPRAKAEFVQPRAKPALYPQLKPQSFAVIRGTFGPEMPSLVDLGGDPNMVSSESSPSFEEPDNFIQYSMDQDPTPSHAVTSEVRKPPPPADSLESVGQDDIAGEPITAAVVWRLYFDDDRYHVKMFLALGISTILVYEVEPNEEDHLRVGIFNPNPNPIQPTNGLESALDWVLKQYVYIVRIELTTRDLEITKQESSEDFATFEARWRKKAAKMKNSPLEEDQVRIVVKNLQPKYLSHIYTQAITDFKCLHATGLQIEKAIKLGLIGKEEAPPPKKTFPTCTSHASVNSLDPALTQDPFQASSSRSSIALAATLTLST
ncbi:hypothetical protein RHMOL_Rhmol03G0143500 [Rhododendron molle]|uniref:Uncharacterized protein n=1 Tax=Rhododendron molle TaxID=49168 RepID=A0ACC0PGH2_RHOML|nr:hypothetical protein RHMOL_Rhmol03G0143500 [Rhododendron molle]